MTLKTLICTFNSSNGETVSPGEEGKTMNTIEKKLQYQTNKAMLSNVDYVSVLYGADVFVTYENGKIVNSGSRSTK